MPQYIFICDNCKESFEDYCSMSKIDEFSPNCPQCKSKKVFRDFKAEKVGGFVGVRTVGALADRNADKMSSDQLENIKRENTEYLRNKTPEWRNPRPRRK